MQRNLGANAGLDYRELSDFLGAIVHREVAALGAFFEGCTAEGGEACRGCARDGGRAPETAQHRSGGCSVECNACGYLLGTVEAAEGPCSSGSSSRAGPRPRASLAAGPPSQEHAAPALEPARTTSAKSDGPQTRATGAWVCQVELAELWKRQDAVDVVLRHVHGPEQQAAALQHVLNMRRASLVLRELNSKS